MSLQDQGTNSSPTDVSVRRKRGHPKREQSESQEEDAAVSPTSDSTKKNKQTVSVGGAAPDDMLGRVITGVIEGSFDAGYFLNVRSVDTDTHLRGVVFMPGRFSPVTAANDIAPCAKMYQREEMRIPSSMEKLSSEKPVEVKDSITMEDEKQSSSLQTDEVSPIVTEKVLEPDTLGAEVGKGKELESDRIGKHISVAGLTNASVGTLEQLCNTLPSKKASNPDSMVEQKATSSEPKPEYQQTSLSVGQEHVNDRGGEATEIHAPDGKGDSLEQGTHEDAGQEPSAGIVIEDKQSNRDGFHECYAARAVMAASCSTLMPSLPMMLAASSTSPTRSDLKPVLKESVLPVKVLLEARNSTVDITNNVKENTDQT